MKQTIFEDVYK